MKKNLALIAVGIVIVCMALKAQPTPQIRPVTVTETTYPPVTWTGSNAQCVASQLLSITNMDGSLVAPTNFPTTRNVLIVIRVQQNSNGVQSVTATVR